MARRDNGPVEGPSRIIRAQPSEIPHFRHAPDQRGLAVVDIFRIENGYLVEHWDIIQPVPDPAETKNSNGMF